MPAIIDHDQRRLEIAQAVESIVATTGVQAVTIREVGKVAGFSPTVITHYFQNKLELMTFTYVNARLRSTSRVEQQLAADASALQCISQCLPTTDDRQTEWKVWFGFWGMVTENPNLKQEQSRGVEDSLNLFSRVYLAAETRGELSGRANINALATRAQYLVDGIACLALQQPELWTAEKQIATLETELKLVQ